ncbi:myb-related transcription factor, partner of profilin-like [Ambystoma mexicanum]|uniref:myb-related transcription factor, partner of profilin-like n=1 Tax=Ambystoma mexicanum TaxID=8296 RepID=UPI0037E96453
MSSRIPETRQRKPCFSGVQLQMLTDTLVEHAGEVFSMDQLRRTQQLKKEIWQEVAEKGVHGGDDPCTVKDCHKWWDDLQLRVRNLLSTHRRQCMAIGGGPSSLIRLLPLEEKCSSVVHMKGNEGVGAAEAGASTPADGDTSSDSDGGPLGTSRGTRCGRQSTPRTTTTQDTAVPTVAVTDAPITQAAPALATTAAFTTQAAPALATTATPTTQAAPAAPAMAQLPTRATAGAQPYPPPKHPPSYAPDTSDEAADDAGETTGNTMDHTPHERPEYSPINLHSPPRSPFPTVRDMDGRLSRFEERQERLSALVQQQPGGVPPDVGGGGPAPH